MSLTTPASGKKTEAQVSTRGSYRTVHHQLPLQRSKILSQEQPGEMPYMDAAKDSEETPP